MNVECSILILIYILKAYFKNQNPADYGSDLYSSNNYESLQQGQVNRNRTSSNKDPLINNGLVKNSPTPRQEQILSQLATLKQVRKFKCRIEIYL